MKKREEVIKDNIPQELQKEAKTKVRKGRDITTAELPEPDLETLDTSPQVARKQALLKLVQYLKVNKLDPEKNYAKDPEHGPRVKKYYDIIRLAEQKIIGQSKKLIKPEVHMKVRSIKKQPGTYDYPLVDGKPMDKHLRKKYRSKMRDLLKARMDPKQAKETTLKYVQKLRSMGETAVDKNVVASAFNGEASISLDD